MRLFDEDIPRERVIEACRFIGADSIIKRMKEGYDTRLSERGSGLSAGERQLISFARIIVFQPRILILDEATANLDSHTEQLIQNALQLVAEGGRPLSLPTAYPPSWGGPNLGHEQRPNRGARDP